MIRGIILDLDGTVYLGDAEVPGAGRFVREMHSMGIRCMFVTNRANRPGEEVAAQLRRYGIECEAVDVLTSTEATIKYLKKGSVFYIGEKSFGEAIEQAGFTVTDRSPEYVIVSFERNVPADKISKAAALVRGGARFIATNPDKALKIENSVLPGTGAIVDAVADEAGRQPDVMIGKPETLIIEMALRKMSMSREEVIMVGDNVETDIPAGAKAGVRTVLILTGISKREDLANLPHQPAWIVESYEELSKIVASAKA